MRMIRSYCSVVSLLVLATGCAEIQQSEFATYDQAKSKGLLEQGWLPTCVPTTARGIQEAHDLDTNEQWLAFDGLAEPPESWTRLGTPQVRALQLRRPRGVAWWPADLNSARDAAESGRTAYAIADTNERCYVSISDPRSFCWCVPM